MQDQDGQNNNTLESSFNLVNRYKIFNQPLFDICLINKRNLFWSIFKEVLEKVCIVVYFGATCDPSKQ